MKKRLLWFAEGLGILVLLAVPASLGHGWYLRYADRSYHKQLPRSLQLRSEAFEDRGLIPTEYSCEKDGGGSPPLSWSNIPEDARSLVVIAIDPDIPSSTLQMAEFTHWVLYNIPPELGEFPAHMSSGALHESGITVGENGAGQQQFYPPCPLSGTHDYRFRLYALDVDRLQTENGHTRGILAEMEGHILAYGELTGKYQCLTLDMKAALRWNVAHMDRRKGDI